MKILQIVTRRQYRGAEVFAANLSEELIKLGHKILFVGLYNNSENVLSVEGAENLELCTRKKEGISPQLVMALARLIRREKPDVVQCNGSDTLKYMVAASYFTRKVPIVYRNISTISEWLDSAIKKKIYTHLFNHVDFVTSVGSESIQDLRDTFNYPKEKTAVIRRGIPFQEYDAQKARTHLRSELGLSRSDKIAIHVGNFSPEKNHSFLLEIFSNLKENHPDIKLVCVGSGVTFDKIKREIHAKGLEETVYLMGFRKNIPELLAGSDCFVLSSLVEGVPGVILEAAVQKKPSIATNVGGVQEVIRNQETGFIINNFDQVKFKQALIEVLKNEVLRSRMGEKAYELVREEFNPSRNAKRFEELYKKLVEPKMHVPKVKGKLKILQIIQKKQFRGAELFASQLSNHLIKKGHEIEIYSIYDGQANLPFEKGVKTFHRPKTARHLDYNGWKSIAKVVKEFEPDIVQANASDTLKYTVLSKIAFGWNVPIVYRNASVSSFYIKNSLSKLWNGMLLKHVDRIISVSRRSKEDLNSFFPFTRDKSQVITIGVEENIRPERSPYASGFQDILHVGSLTVEKNHTGLLRIFKNIHNRFPKTRLHLVGEGPLREKVKLEIGRLGLSESVILHGEIRDPYSYISNADTLVLPSHIEGLPAVILESMLLETPVVAYAVGGIPEVLDDLTGFPIEHQNEKEFQKAVELVLKFRPEEKVQQAKIRVTENYLNKNLVKDFLKVYYQARIV